LEPFFYELIDQLNDDQGDRCATKDIAWPMNTEIDPGEIHHNDHPDAEILQLFIVRCQQEQEHIESGVAHGVPAGKSVAGLMGDR
jgi:hypothetical protein